MFRLFRFNIQTSVFGQLTFIAILIVINFASVNTFDNSLSEIEKTVDLAESNGTYSQQIPLFAQRILIGQDQYRPRLSEAIDNFQVSLNTLRNGGISPEDKTSKIAPVPQNVKSAFDKLALIWQDYKVHAENLVQQKVVDQNGNITEAAKENYNNLFDDSPRVLQRNNELVGAYLRHFDEEQEFRDFVFLSIFLVNIISVVSMFFYVSIYVSKPISKLNEIETIISDGDFERQIDYQKDDELGRVAKSINTLFRNLQNATEFIINIGEGKLNTEYQRPTGTDAQHDRLGTALLEMRGKMREVNEQDRQRNWVSEGLAKFADIFQNQKDSEDFTYIIISELVKYVDANQGGLFIVENEKDDDSHLELIAAYAYEKRKYVTKRIDKGEGLIGEVYQEGSMIYMTDVPDGYVNITSGLGDANPRSILLVPLKLNEEIYGVLELASFFAFEPYKIEFVEKLGESIASTFASVKNSKQTELLLRESIQLSEQMKAQEEEMRQNLEELVATQEEVQRTNQLIEKQKTELEQQLEGERKKYRNLEKQQKSLQIQYDAAQKTIAELEKENKNLQEGFSQVSKDA